MPRRIFMFLSFAEQCLGRSDPTVAIGFVIFQRGSDGNPQNSTIKILPLIWNIFFLFFLRLLTIIQLLHIDYLYINLVVAVLKTYSIIQIYLCLPNHFDTAEHLENFLFFFFSIYFASYNRFLFSSYNYIVCPVHPIRWQFYFPRSPSRTKPRRISGRRIFKQFKRQHLHCCPYRYWSYTPYIFFFFYHFIILCKTEICFYEI